MTPPQLNGFAYAPADMSHGTFGPDTLARHVNDYAPNSTTSWFADELDLTDPSFATLHPLNTLGVASTDRPVTPE